MATKGNFSTTKTVLKMHNVFAQTVAEEIGMTRTLELSAKAMEKMGMAQGYLVKQQKRIKNFNAHDVAPLVRIAYESLGIRLKIVQVSPRSILVKCNRCLIYTAARELGMDDDTIEMWCRAGSIRSIDALVKQLNPDLVFRLVKFRSNSEDFCEEEIVEMIDLGPTLSFVKSEYFQ